MLFNSIQYMIFFPLICMGYYLIPHKFRWILLLCGSYFFYMCWNVKYALLMLVSTLVTYISGILIYKEKKNKKKWVILSFAINLGILFFFKYLNFFIDSLQTVFDYIEISIKLPNFKILLPVGISFYTFQALSYTMDVYRGKLKPTNHIGKYALFVSFFPQLVAGPIERSEHLLSQFDKVHTFNYDEAKKGIMLIIFGLIKKVVIADRLSILVNTVYNNVGKYGGQEYLIASFFFAFQIYCDFSGYSDIAIGSAKIMGFDLMKNFNAPYLSKSIGEFWRRWHISLSTWFKDYLYIPLGGNRVSKIRWSLNIMIVFLVSGLWHGANWTFIIWGGLHGVYQVIEKYMYNIKKKYFSNSYGKALSIIITFVLVDFAWIFFRANNVADAFHIITNLFIFNGNFDLYKMGMNKYDLIFSLIMISVLILIDVFQNKSSVYNLIQSKCLPIRWCIYMVSIFTIILFGIYGDVTEASFIYFQF